MSETDRDPAALEPPIPPVPDATQAEEDAEFEAAKRAMRRGRPGQAYLYLLALIIALMATSPLLNRFLEAYQGVVVTLLANGSVVILQQEGLLIEREMSDAMLHKLAVGRFLKKVPARWNPEVVDLEALGPRADTDDPELQPAVFLPPRMILYLETWRGTIVAVKNERVPTLGLGLGGMGEQSTLVVELDGGGTKKVILNEALRAVLADKVVVGLRLRKEARRWVPELLPQAAAAPPAPTTPEAPPATAPEVGSPAP